MAHRITCILIVAVCAGMLITLRTCDPPPASVTDHSLRQALQLFARNASPDTRFIAATHPARLLRHLRDTPQLRTLLTQTPLIQSDETFMEWARLHSALVVENDRGASHLRAGPNVTFPRAQIPFRTRAPLHADALDQLSAQSIAFLYRRLSPPERIALPPMFQGVESLQLHIAEGHTDLIADLHLYTRDPSTAVQLAEDLEGVLALATFEARYAPRLTPLLRSSRVTSMGNRVTIAATLSSDTLEALVAWGDTP
jgi:hypothetical protein